MPESLEAAVARLVQSAVDQGFTEKITDPLALARLAAISEPAIRPRNVNRRPAKADRPSQLTTEATTPQRPT